MPFTLLTMDEAAKQARITRRFLNKRIADGRDPVITRIGCKPLVRSDELLAWLERCTESRPAQAA